MGSTLLLYEAVKEKLGTQYKNIFFQTMREDVVGDVGIFLYGSSNDVEDLEGDEVYNCIKVQIQVNSTRDIQGMNKAIAYLEKFTRRIEEETCSIAGLNFIEAQHIGPRAIAIGKNNYDILVCRSVVDLKYNFSD